MMKNMQMPEWETRSKLPEEMLHILSSNENEVSKIALLEDLIVFIEKRHFLRDIEYTSSGAMKDTTFFWEKGELIKIIKILPEILRQKVLPALFDKLEQMLPEEKQSFKALQIAEKLTSISHDRNVFGNLKKIVKDDLIQTREFLLECINNNHDYEEKASRLLKLIPGDEYFNPTV